MGGITMQAVAQQKQVADTLHRFFLPGGNPVGGAPGFNCHLPPWLGIESTSPDVYSPVKGVVKISYINDHPDQISILLPGKKELCILGVDTFLVKNGDIVLPGTKLGEVKKAYNGIYDLRCILLHRNRYQTISDTEVLLKRQRHALAVLHN